MHAGFFHLFANMASLMFSGNFIEKIIGKKRFLWFYLSAGIFSGALFVLTSFLFNFEMNSYAVGASGALFGLVGLLMILTPNLPVYMMFIPIPIKMKFAAPAMLILLWIISYVGDIPIGNIAHFGGLIVGVIYGFYLKKKYKNKTRNLNQFFS
jgi:membrane associated rhomboid family serine protease